jgi:hypothetical protein
MAKRFVQEAPHVLGSDQSRGGLQYYIDTGIAALIKSILEHDAAVKDAGNA